MNGLVATALRELRAYFVSPLAYGLLFFLLAFNGVVFALILAFLNDPLAPAGRPLDLFFGGTFFFWLVLAATVPLLTMRLLAEERRSGTIEVLMTAPVTENQVVAGKYLAVLVFYLFLWLPTLVYPVILEQAGDIDWGLVASGYLGIFLLGALFLAAGLFASSLTSSQILAAAGGFAAILGLLALSLLEALAGDPAWREVFAHVSVLTHMEELARGVVDTRRLVFYASTTLFFLVLAARSLAAKKWR